MTQDSVKIPRMISCIAAFLSATLAACGGGETQTGFAAISSAQALPASFSTDEPGGRAAAAFPTGAQQAPRQLAEAGDAMAAGWMASVPTDPVAVLVATSATTTVEGGANPTSPAAASIPAPVMAPDPVVAVAPPTATPTVPAPPATAEEVATPKGAKILGAPAIDIAKIPLGVPGFSSDMLKPATSAPVPAHIGAFRTVCDFSHMSFDDPIVFPGQPGLSHLHVFFGNTATDANSTANSIAHTGNSTCRGGTINRSSYWVPAVIDTKDGTPIKPKSIIVYYKVGYRGAKADDIRPFPAGLRMIAGDPTASAPVQWGPADISCMTASGETKGHAIPDCPAGGTVWFHVAFPNCWDGVNLDSPDHRSHMMYFPNGGKCPPSHPVVLPEVTFNVLYPVTESGSTLRWRLASDTYDKSLPAGYSLHGDWFGGWKPEIMDAWIKGCDQASKDCLAHLLGDGRQMVW